MRILTSFDANPYQAHKQISPKWTMCETCDRKIESKDWNAHQAGKKHQKAKKELNEKEVAEKMTATKDWGDHVNDDAAQQEVAGWADDIGFTSAGPHKNKSGTGSHFNSSEPRNGGGDGGTECYGCGQIGHRKSDCPSREVKSCFNCGERGHRKADCPNPSQAGGGRPCYNCGEVGHLKSECVNPSNPNAGGDSRPCFKCGQTGHMAKDCNFCANCGQEGHSFFQCGQKKDWSKITCSVCKQTGHTKKKCPQAQEMEANGGGFGGGGFESGLGASAAGGWDTAGDSAGDPWATNGNWGGDFEGTSNGWKGETQATAGSNWDGNSSSMW